MLSAILSGGLDLPRAIAMILSSLAVIMLTLPVHEWAHAFTAVKLGDPTPRFQGRLSLNPFAHIDWLGAACILLFGWGWAKPVQINAGYFKKPKVGMAITALAGPASNIIVAFLSLVLASAIRYLLMFSMFSVYVYYFFYYLAQINISLAVFNMIPIPPLDGSRLLAAFLPNKQYYALMRYERYLFFAVLALIWLGVLDIPISFLSRQLMNGLSFLAGLPFRFIGV